MINVSPTLNVMISAARKAGRSLVRDFGEVEQLQVSIKGPANFVSAADHKAEDIIFRELSKARPGYGFLMEERGEVAGADTTHRWIVDPLDGTTNFLHSNPLFAISIALEREGLEGAIALPIRSESGAAVGCLGIANFAPRTFTQQEIADLIARGTAISKQYS